VKASFLFALLLIDLWLMPFFSAAQNQDRFSRNVTKQYGLPTQTVYDLHVDELGYLYLATDLGLFRFNGNRFQRIPSLGNVDSPVDNLLTLEGNSLWAKNFANQVFYLENDTLKVLEELGPQLGKQNILIEIYGHEQSLYIISRQKLFRYKPASGIEVLVDNQGEGYFSSAVIDASGNLKYINNDSYESVLGQNVQKLVANNSSTLSVFKEKVYSAGKGIGTGVFDLQNSKPLSLDNLPSNAYLYFLRATSDQLWACTSEGLYEVDTGNGLRDYAIDMKDYRVSDIVEDGEGNLWVSTLDDGVFFFPNFRIYNTEVNNLRSGASQSYTSLATTPFGTLLVGTNNGHILEMNTSGDVLRNIDTEYNIEVEFIYFDDSRNRIICTNGIFDYQEPSNEGAVYLGKQFYPDDDGNYLIAHSVFAGLVHQELNRPPQVGYAEKYVMKSYNGLSPYVLELLEARSKSVHFLEKDQLYFIGGIDDLYQMDKSGNIQSLRLEKDKALVINTMTEDETGGLWLGSSQQGLLHWKQGKLIPVLQSRLLKENYIQKLIPFQNDLFILSNNDLFRYHKSGDSTERLPVSDIFSGLKVNDMLIMDESIWVASNEGVHTFRVDERWVSSPPRLLFKGMQVNGLADERDYLNYTENNISLLYDLIQLGSNGSSMLRYRISNVSEKWENLPGTNGQLNFASLSPGTYEIEFQGFAKGLFSNLQTVRFRIVPPWWQRTVYLIGLGLMGFALITLLVTRKERRKRRMEQIRTQLAKSQMKSLRSQMNPHFIFNILNAVQGFIYAGRKSDAAAYLSDFSILMRKTLELSDEQSITLKEELDLLKLYVSLELPRFEDEVDFTLEMEENIDLEGVKIPPLLIQPFLENALKHGLMHKEGHKTLRVTITLVDSETLEIRIADNGIGREASKNINQKRKNHRSFATNAIFSRVDLINRFLKKPIQIQIEDVLKDSQNQGTIVIIRVPFFYA
jgi:ligand-binding sensor domain-containing protein